MYGDAAGQDDDTRLSAHRVVHVAAQILGADVDVDDDQLRLAGDQEIGVCGGHGHVLVQARHQGGHALAIRGQRDERFLKRGGIGARVQKDIVDAARDQELDDRFRTATRRCTGRQLARTGDRWLELGGGRGHGDRWPV